MNPEKKVLFVWSGGGLPGLDIHLGLWRALDEAGIRSTHNCGTSAGAIVAALDSAGWQPQHAELMLRGLADSDVRAPRFLWRLRLPWINSIFSPEPIVSLIRRLLPRSFDELLKPLTVTTTRCADGVQINFSGATETWTANLHAAVLASTAISGIWPAVRIDGREYSDGGTVANLPLPADWREYDEVWLLIATRPQAYKARARGVLSRLMLNLDYYATDQIRDILGIVSRAGARPRVRILWPSLSIDTGTLHFRHDLIDAAYRFATDKIEKRK